MIDKDKVRDAVGIVEVIKGHEQKGTICMGDGSKTVPALSILLSLATAYLNGEIGLCMGEKEIFNIILQQHPRGLLGNATGGGSMRDAYPDEWKLAHALIGKVPARMSRGEMARTIFNFLIAKNWSMKSTGETNVENVSYELADALTQGGMI